MYCSDSDCACEICYSKLDSSQLLQDETVTDVVLELSGLGLYMYVRIYVHDLQFTVCINVSSHIFADAMFTYGNEIIRNIKGNLSLCKSDKLLTN